MRFWEEYQAGREWPVRGTVMHVIGRLLVLLVSGSLLNAVMPGQARAAQTWAPSFNPDDIRYRSPHEGCAALVSNIIEADRPSRPPTAQYRHISSAVQPIGDGDYHCTGLLHVRIGPGTSNWTLIPYVGDALIRGSGDSCSLPGYTDPVNGQCGPPKCTNNCSGAGGNGSNPIHSASGSKFQRDVDFAGTGAFPLRVTRYYNSNRVIERKSIPVGVGWSHSYSGSIAGAGTPFDLAIVHRPDASCASRK